MKLKLSLLLAISTCLTLPAYSSADETEAKAPTQRVKRRIQLSRDGEKDYGPQANHEGLKDDLPQRPKRRIQLSHDGEQDYGESQRLLLNENDSDYGQPHSLEKDSNKVKRRRVETTKEEKEDSDSSSSLSSSPSSNDNEGVIDPGNSIQKFAKAVLEKDMTAQELKHRFRLTDGSLRAYLSQARRLRLLSHEDTLHLDSRVEKSYYTEVKLEEIASAIKEKKPLKYILQTFEFPNKKELNKMITKCYTRNMLESKDVQYLKSEKTVIGRPGDTKAKILHFLKKRCKSQPTKTLQDLNDEFNESPFKTIRNIKFDTFRQHINELESQGKLAPTMKDFVNDCRHRPRGREVRTVRRAFGTSQQVFK